MKKILNFSLVVLIVFALSSCNNSGSPEAVAEKYLQAFSKGDFQAAKEFATKESASLLDFMATMSQNIEELSTLNIKSEIKNVKCEVNGDVAKYSCDLYVTNGEEEEGEPNMTPTELDLVKVDGKWLVKQEKEGGDDGMDFDYDEVDDDDEMDIEEDIEIEENVEVTE